MSNLSGTNLAAPIVPFTTDDSYPTHKALYGHGGWRSVQTFTDLAALPAARLEEGSAAWVADEMKAYVLVQNAWQELGVPSVALKETVSCFFPMSPPSGSMIMWTAGVDVDFGTSFTGVGNIMLPPDSTVEITVTNNVGDEVGKITVDNTGVFAFDMTQNGAGSLVVPTGSYLAFTVTGADISAQNVSFTLTGMRVQLP